MTAIEIDKLDFQKLGGLLPVIIQDSATNSVLMLGFMNEAALRQTIAGGKVVFWSRTKRRLWEKGEASGNALIVKLIAADCDNDSLLIRTTPRGPVCHTGAASCFGAGDKG